MKHYQNSPTRHRPRGGFTLIELIMVIAIIATLAALIFPAINSVRSGVKVTEVRQEISGLESAIADFKLKFGQAPPSRITLHEQWTNGWATDRQSRAIIRGLWPKFNFGDGTGSPADLNTRIDFNNNSYTTDSFTLKGDQCLVFFLGGFWNPNDGFRGFSPIPTKPFAAALGTTGPSSAVGPFFDFDLSRVKDEDGDVPGADYAATNASLAYFPVYFDPIPDQQRPYIYSSSYEGTGYDVADVQTPAAPAFNGYTVNANGLGWKSKTFQIISAGFDGDYGTGGLYDPDANPAIDAAGKDNITNFTTGMLDQ
jgi:prepilin-type N-terminal cleavage/methylation domain-containing protein